ncbi:MAG: hypothetical protein ABR499_10920 [Gemmatimonadaceae bacterium]
MSRVRSIPRIGHVLTIAALAALGACAEQKPTEPPAPAPLEATSSPSATLVECPTDETLSATVPIGPEGGTVALGGTSVLFPAGVLEPNTLVTLTIPASKYVEIAIRTNGANEFSYDVNLQPVITIDYSRCRRSDVLVKPLTAWYIDSNTKTPRYQMEGAVDNKLLKTVTFPTQHFSGYAIAF